MQIKEYLEKHQPIIYQTFVNAVRNDQLSHAYLLSGSNGMPLKQTAMFLAKSILCDNPSPLACNDCITCIRVDEGNYPDVMIFDGEEGKIKKGDIEKIIDNFDKSALESKGIMIYILHLVETMTSVAVNSLLKFLEEPGKNIYAFLTTENESKVLPTILSRTQILRFKSIDRDRVISEAIEEGVKPEDAEMLSAFYNDSETIKKISEDDKYLTAKEALRLQVEALLVDRDTAIFTNQRKVIPVMKDSQECARLYIKMLSEIFKDLVHLSVKEDITLKSYESDLNDLYSKIKNTDKLLTMLMSATSKLDVNVNIPLLLDHIIYVISREVD